MQIKALIYAVLFVFDELVFKLIDYTYPNLRGLTGTLKLNNPCESSVKAVLHGLFSHGCGTRI